MNSLFIINRQNKTEMWIALYIKSHITTEEYQIIKIDRGTITLIVFTHREQLTKTKSLL